MFSQVTCFPTKGLLPPKSCLPLEAVFFSDIGGSTAPKPSSYQNTATFHSEDIEWRTDGDAFAAAWMVLESEVWSCSSHCARAQCPTQVRLSVRGPSFLGPAVLSSTQAPVLTFPRRKALSYLAPESPGFIPPHPNTAFFKIPFLRVCGSPRKPSYPQPDSLPCFALRTFTLQYHSRYYHLSNISNILSRYFTKILHFHLMASAQGIHADWHTDRLTVWVLNKPVFWFCLF